MSAETNRRGRLVVHLDVRSESAVERPFLDTKVAGLGCAPLDESLASWRNVLVRAARGIRTRSHRGTDPMLDRLSFGGDAVRDRTAKKGDDAPPGQRIDGDALTNLTHLSPDGVMFGANALSENSPSRRPVFTSLVNFARTTRARVWCTLAFTMPMPMSM